MTVTTTSTPTTTLAETLALLDAASRNWAGPSGHTATEAVLHLQYMQTQVEASNEDRLAAIAQRNEAVASHQTTKVALRDFKEAVREAAIEAQAGHASHMTKDSLNEWLTGLGLDPVVTKWNCEGTWQGMDLPSATVEAADEESALDKYRAALQDAEVTISLAINGDVSDTDEVVFDSNSISEENDYFSDIEFDIDDADLSAESADD